MAMANSFFLLGLNTIIFASYKSAEIISPHSFHPDVRRYWSQLRVIFILKGEEQRGTETTAIVSLLDQELKSYPKPNALKFSLLPMHSQEVASDK